MRPTLRLAAICVVASALLFSCSPTANQAVWLGPSATIGSDNPKIVSQGQTVEILGEVSPDSSQTRIRFEGVEGWLSSDFLFKDANLAVMQMRVSVWYETAGGQAAFELYPFEFAVLAESDSGLTAARVVRGSTIYKTWIPDGSFSTAEADVNFVKEFIQLYASTAKTSETLVKLVGTIKSGTDAGVTLAREHCFTWQAKLDEIPPDELVKFMDKHGIYLDQASGTAAAVSMNLETQMQTAIGKLLTDNTEYSIMYDNLPGPRNTWLDNVILTLPSYCTYKAASYREDNGMQLLGFLAYRVDRSPENIKRIWDRYKETIYTAVNQYTWNTRYFGTNAKMLLEAYQHLTSNGKLAAFAEVSKEVEGQSWDQQFDQYSPFMLPAMAESIAEQSNLTDPNYYSMWLHSFWARRYREGNAEVVADILREAITYYENIEPEYAEDTSGDGVIDERGDAETGEDYEGEDEGGDGPGYYIPPVQLPPAGETVKWTCSYIGMAGGDCTHIYFSCIDVAGDFGDAELSEEMPQEDRDEWNNLTSQTTGEFEIELESVQGRQCQGIEPSEWPEGPVPLLRGFKRKQ